MTARAMMVWAAMGALGALATGCADDGDDGVETETLARDLPPIPLPLGEEITGQCWSWTLHNEEPLYVHAVHMSATRGIHHSNWFYVDDDTYDAPDGSDGDGLWDCGDRGFDTVTTAASGGVLFAQSTQNIDETQQFLPGAALRLPPHARVVVDLHLLNTYQEDLNTEIHIELDTIPEEAVDTVLRGLAIEYVDLQIQPHKRSEFTVECEMSTFHWNLLGRPLDLSLHYLLPHYHELGDLMRVEVLGGPADGELIYETTASIGEPLSAAMDPPYDLTGADGLRVTCGYDNPRDEEVGWGVGDQEMCVLFGFTDSEAMWGGGVLVDDDQSEIVEQTDELVRYEAPCTVFGSLPDE
ncbi:MAG: hypothetical protein ACOC97_05340 [Myxococcota bacterium]